ncbi:toprim domain-containing protein [Roseomonas sp. BN140053]|uniref:DUF7146 domain-containing protein n=1 Tax=Roseomonas sp. BN140053 TaxID=3391898 RepID=UPI0039E7A526
MRDAPNNDLDLIREGLRASVQQLCVDLLGKPSSKSGSEWRWGRKGSMAVSVSGAKRGLWHDHESGQGGDMLALIRRERSGDFSATVAWARGFLGMGEAPEWAPHERKAKPQDRAKQAAAEAEDAVRRGVAERLWRDAVPIAGTVADRYLTETRRIPRPDAGWPASAVRFHPGRCALILAATAEAGDVQAVQLVHLTAEGTKREEEGRPTKQSFGPQEGAVVRLPGDRSALLLAEGPETSLSVWAATGRETWVALGSVGKIQPPSLRKVVACADDDPKDAPAAKQLRKAVSRWRSEARDVAVATPWNPRRYDKSDFNDLIRREGPEAVAARIKAALSPRGNPGPSGKPQPAPLARHRLGEAVKRFFRLARDYDPDLQDDPAPPIAHGIKVDVGVGKSEAARREAADYLAELRSAGDDRNIAFAVPTHQLGEEQARAFEALPAARSAELRAAVWRGREADDPDAPGEKMCRDLDAVRDAKAVWAPVEQTACRNSKTGAVCPFFEECGYQRQKKQRADLWLAPHELLFNSKPAAMGKLALLVVDEAAWQDGLEGVNGPPMDVTLDTLASDIASLGSLGGLNAQRLRDTLRRIGAALQAAPDGPVRRADMLAADVTAETGRDGRALALDWLVKAEMQPGMTPQQRREAMGGAAGNRTMIRLSRLFGAVEALMREDGPEASGWAEVVTENTEDGRQRLIRLRGRREVRKGWQVPSLHLDALLNPTLVRPYWQQLEVVAEIAVLTPHMRIRQQVGKDWAKSALVPDEYDPDDRDRRLKNSEKLRAAVWREARSSGGRVLVVAQKAVRTYWEECGPIPGNVELAHHNAVAGRDQWGPGPDREGVSLLTVVGRTQPRTSSVERMAEALTGAAVAKRAAGFRYDRRDAAIELADGSSVSAEADCHPDPTAEAIRWQICEGELIQIIGRGRGVNRTAANPLEVLILTDRPLPLPVDEAVTWEDLAPAAADLMLSQGGVALESPTDAHRCYPNFWPSPDAAKKAAQRGQWGTNPIEYLSKGECPPLVTATYQRAGERQRPARVHFDPAAVPKDELRGWLEDRLGPLVRLDLDPPPEPTPPGPGNRPPTPEAPPAGVVEPVSAPEPVWAGPLGTGGINEGPDPLPAGALNGSPPRSNAGECGPPPFENNHRKSNEAADDLGGYLHPSVMGMRPMCRIGSPLDGLRFGSAAERKGVSGMYARTREGGAPPGQEFRSMYVQAREAPNLQGITGSEAPA